MNWPDPLTVVAEPTPSTADLVHVASSYAELFWLPTVGPSCMWMARRFADGAHRPQTWVLDDLARTIGLHSGTGVNAAVVRTLRRLLWYRWVTPPGADGAVVFKEWVPRLRPGQLARLPVALQASHATFVEEIGLVS